MKCRNCGEENVPEAVRCQRCGESLVLVTDQATAPKFTFTPSRVQFSVLYILTFGVYHIYWLVKIARVMGYIKGDKNRAWRLLLLLIPLYNLFVYARIFGEVEDEAKKYETKPVPSLALLAFGAIFMGWLWRLSDTWFFLGLLSFVPTAMVQSYFTRMQLAKWAASITPYRYRWGDWLVIVLGAAFTAMVCLGATVPPPGGAPQNLDGMWLTALGTVAALVVFWRLDQQDRGPATDTV
jgi:hypothetical protein